MDYSDKIELLINFLPSISNLQDKTIVIKYGGAAMTDAKLTQNVVQDLILLSSFGVKIIVVHGGGPEINTWLDKVQIQPKFEKGVRITDHKTMEIVEMVLAGKVNKYLVTLLNTLKAKAVGLCGKDAKILIAEPIDVSLKNKVGKIKEVNTDLLKILLDNQYIPILAPVALDLHGNSYNINADTVAGAIASSLSVDHLLVLTDTPGILRDAKDPSSLITSLRIDDIYDLIDKNIISGGMLPKVDCCINALKAGVKSTSVLDGRLPHSLLMNLLRKETSGSTIEI